MIEEAKRRTPGNVNCVLADVLAGPLPGKDYDAIFSISALHHMPLKDSLPVLEAALRPGGVLAAIALPRPDLRHELPVEIVAAAGHLLLGAMFLAERPLGSNGGFAKDSTHSAMPVVMDPPLPTREVAIRTHGRRTPGRAWAGADSSRQLRGGRPQGVPATRRRAAPIAAVVSDFTDVARLRAGDTDRDHRRG